MLIVEMDILDDREKLKQKFFNYVDIIESYVFKKSYFNIDDFYISHSIIRDRFRCERITPKDGSEDTFLSRPEYIDNTNSFFFKDFLLRSSKHKESKLEYSTYIDIEKIDSIDIICRFKLKNNMVVIEDIEHSIALKSEPIFGSYRTCHVIHTYNIGRDTEKLDFQFNSDKTGKVYLFSELPHLLPVVSDKIIMNPTKDKWPLSIYDVLDNKEIALLEMIDL